VDLSILSSAANKPKIIPRKRKIEEPVSNAFELTAELRLQIAKVAKREVDALVKQNFVEIPKNNNDNNNDKIAKKKRRISK